MGADGRDGRVASLDFWRGCALATIFVNHIPGNPIEPFTHKNFGFSDAAEIFVFLAGISVALAYAARQEAVGFLRTAATILGRAATIYGHHLVVLLVCGAVVAFGVLATNDVRLLEATHFDVLVESPIEAVAGIATLGFQPAYINILPLYIVLMLAAPGLLNLAIASPRAALGLSVSLYVAAHLFGLDLPSFPASSGWYFNPFTWQLLFVIGICTGLALRDGRILDSRPLFIVALFYLAAATLWTRSGFYNPYDLSPLPRFVWDFDKTALTLPRLLHALALVIVAAKLGRMLALAEFRVARPLILLGRHALPVFCFGTVLAISIQILRMSGAEGRSLDMVLIVAGLLAQIGLAAILEWYRSASSKQTSAAARTAADTA